VLPTIKTFAGGTAGAGGDSNTLGGNIGDPGNAGQCWDFTTNIACN
jgi:hypothetical protein